MNEDKKITLIVVVITAVMFIAVMAEKDMLVGLPLLGLYSYCAVRALQEYFSHGIERALLGCLNPLILLWVLVMACLSVHFFWIIFFGW